MKLLKINIIILITLFSISTLVSDDNKAVKKNPDTKIVEGKKLKLLKNNGSNLFHGNIKKGETFNLGNIKFISIPGGTFLMGSEKGEGWGDEIPKHKVRIDSFWMSVYEVTQGDYKKITGKTPSHYDNENNPVNRVTWHDAVKFCKLLNEKYKEELNDVDSRIKMKVRLPYEAEWEYACRAGSKTLCYWGEDKFEDYCWYGKNSKSAPKPVGQKKPNLFGLYDMNGNVWEWCLDYYKKDYYTSSPENNPTGPLKGKAKVLRGGAWDSEDDLILRSGTRHKYYPNIKYASYGFRIVIVKEKQLK